MHDFVTASTWAALGDGRFQTTPDPRWFQGKGAYGGLLAAGTLRAMATLVDAGRRPRTLHVHFCAPVKDAPLELAVVVERAGASVTVLSARATQQGATALFATATFAAPRGRPDERARYLDAKMPEVPAPDDVPAVPVDMPLMPAFAQHLEYRFCLGDPPWSGGERALIGGWLRFRVPVAADIYGVAALADAYPPAVMSRLSEPRAASSVDFTIDFLDVEAAPVVAAGEHVLVAQRSRRGDGGTTDEQCDVWSRDGRLLCSVRQLVALL